MLESRRLKPIPPQPPARPRKNYEKPQVRTLTKDDMLDAIGPAQASGSGGVEPPYPGGRRRRRH